MARVPGLAALLVPAALLALLLPAGALPVGDCPVPAAVRALQDDGGSGRDAGDARGPGAVPLAAEGWSWGSFDPPVEYGLEDVNDWYVVDVPPGARDVTIQVIAGTNQVAPPDTVVMVYHLAVWEEGRDDSAVADTISYLPSMTFQTGGGVRFHLHVTMNTLIRPVACAPGQPPLDGPGVVPQLLQSYGAYFACEPDCLA